MNNCSNLLLISHSLSYHRFTNLREIFQGDLSRKLTVGLTSQDFEPLPYNCRTGGNDACGYNNMCMNSTVAHKVKCKNTAKVCKGNNQQKLKAAAQQHFNEVHKLVKLGEKSDSRCEHHGHLHVKMQLGQSHVGSNDSNYKIIKASVDVHKGEHP